MGKKIAGMASILLELEFLNLLTNSSQPQRTGFTVVKQKAVETEYSLSLVLVASGN